MNIILNSINNQSTEERYFLHLGKEKRNWCELIWFAVSVSFYISNKELFSVTSSSSLAEVIINNHNNTGLWNFIAIILQVFFWWQKKKKEKENDQNL